MHTYKVVRIALFSLVDDIYVYTFDNYKYYIGNNLN